MSLEGDMRQGEQGRRRRGRASGVHYPKLAKGVKFDSPTWVNATWFSRATCGVPKNHLRNKRAVQMTWCGARTLYSPKQLLLIPTIDEVGEQNNKAETMVAVAGRVSG